MAEVDLDLVDMESGSAAASVAGATEEVVLPVVDLEAALDCYRTGTEEKGVEERAVRSHTAKSVDSLPR